MIIIVDYGLGNLASIKNMLKRIGVDSEVTSSLKDISGAKKLILPGVGAFDAGMRNLNQRGITEVLKQRVQVDKIPLLGICLGMQLLTSHSEEGNVPGLNFIKAQTKKFNFDGDVAMKVPHMGWTDVNIGQPVHPLFKGVDTVPRYYFVHSFYVKCDAPSNSIATADYGIRFDCAISSENIVGVQFHPEKSHRFGMQILKNFSELL